MMNHITSLINGCAISGKQDAISKKQVTTYINGYSISNKQVTTYINGYAISKKQVAIYINGCAITGNWVAISGKQVMMSMNGRS